MRRILPLTAAVTFALASLGVLMVYSATRGSEAPYDRSFLQRQALFLVFALTLIAIVLARGLPATIPVPAAKGPDEPATDDERQTGGT